MTVGCPLTSAYGRFSSEPGPPSVAMLQPRNKLLSTSVNPHKELAMNLLNLIVFSERKGYTEIKFIYKQTNKSSFVMMIKYYFNSPPFYSGPTSHPEYSS